MAGAAMMLGGAGVLLGVAATPAQAAEVSYATDCVPPPVSGLPTVKGTTEVEITAPATAKVGDEVELVWKFVRAASKNPDLIDLPANSVQPSGTLGAAGAQAASVAMRGPRENPAIPKGGAMILSDMKGTLKLTTPGKVTLTPDAYAVNVLSTDTKCAPTETVKSAATIDVTAGEGEPPPGSPAPTGPPPTGGTPSPTGSESDSGGSGTGGSTGGGGRTGFTGREVKIPYACRTPIGDRNATSPVQINARKAGGSYDLTVQFRGSVMDSPADIPADSVKPSMEVVLGGADAGSVAVEGPRNAEAIKAGAPMVIPDLTGTYKPGADGRTTLSPGVLTVEALGTTTTCTPTTTAVSLTLDTSAQPGGAVGGGSAGSGSVGGGTGSSAGAGSAGAGGGGLANTGAGDDGALRALGLVAGTALLLGGAVFTFMPRQRDARRAP